MSETWPPRVLNVPRPFAIDRHAVSNAQYRQFVEATGWSRPGHWRSSGRPFGTQDADWPVTHVSFHDAVAYCHWRGGELPSAAQWELAARGTDERLYPWGDRFDTGLCNSAEGRRGSLAPINAYAGGESPFGLLQSTGNVWEWVRCDAPREAAIMGGSFEDPAIVEGMAFANVTRGRGTLQSPRVGFRPILRASTEYDAAPRTAKGYEFDAVPGGTFRSGCPAAMQGHALKVARSNGYTTDWIHDVPETTVRVEGFHIGRFAVSNDLYRVFVEETGHSRPPHWGGGAPYPASTGRHPVANVSIADAFAFCRWLDPDAWLPNLLQWEKAARGIDGRLYPWGNDFAPDLVNSLETGHGAPVAVDSFADGASPCGAVNMAGNVGEWVLSHAAVRGGSFKSDCRLYGLTFYELKAAMTLSDEDTGFRCAYDNFRGDGS